MISATEKNKEGSRIGGTRQVDRSPVLNKVVWKVLNEKLTFEQKIKAHVCDTNTLDRINSRCKGPEAVGMPEMFK